MAWLGNGWMVWYGMVVYSFIQFIGSCCVGSIRTVPSESDGNDFHKRSTSEWTRLLCQPADRRSRSNGEQHTNCWYRLQYHCVDDQANAFGIEIVGGAQGV